MRKTRVCRRVLFFFLGAETFMVALEGSLPAHAGPNRVVTSITAHQNDGAVRMNQPPGVAFMAHAPACRQEGETKKHNRYSYATIRIQ
jgi:hypothetical protein